jgi:hypothetical protein
MQSEIDQNKIFKEKKSMLKLGEPNSYCKCGGLSEDDIILSRCKRY